MSSGSIVYFPEPGKQNTDAVIDIVAERIDEGEIHCVVVASSTGETARKLISRLRDKPVQVVVVTSHCGFEKPGECEMAEEVCDEIIGDGARVVRASHVLSGLERSISRKLGGASRVEAIAEVLKSLFGQGMKVCVEITVMAADSGAIPAGNSEVIAVGGSGWGADTACVVRPAHANSFFDFQVLEVMAMPRCRRE